MDAFLKSAQEVLGHYGIDPTLGNTADSVLKNQETYGVNTFTKEKPKSFVRRVLESAKEPMTILLIIAGLIALGVNILRYYTGGHADFIECIGIFVAILLAIMITVVMEGRSAKAFEALNKLKDDIMVKVVRDGTVQLISQKDLAVGDVVFIDTGDKTPADGRLIESVSLQADESSLTGESLPVKKDAAFVAEDPQTPVAERSNMLYSGCFITSGSGKMVITAVGDSTEFGKIAKELSGEHENTTPLQEKLAKLGKIIAVVGSLIAAIVFALQVVGFILTGTASVDTIAEAFITSIVLIVACVPEGLPTIVAVSLALNIIKMSKQNALVKKMVACETIGCINVICSDKTGTLTENRMTVTHVYEKGQVVNPSELSDPYMIQNFAVNSTANVEFKPEAPKFIGNPTECALLIALHKSGHHYLKIRQDTKVVHSYPFSSETKNMTTIVHQDAQHIIYSKGSPEKILSLCALTPEDSHRFHEQIISFEEQACRVIAFAHRVVTQLPQNLENRDELEQGLQFDGFVAITDPLRQDVYEAVERCRSAGIQLMMLTGDNITTATAIANGLHLIKEGHIAVEAKDVENLSDEEFAKILPTIRVIARSTPIIKMRVVNTLKNQGNVVAVTGDGINDAPAIKHADVGIAMGIAGTEVSKEASDIVLLNDSFSTIVNAVQWGRGIYENFQRFIQFQLTVNLSSVIVVLASILGGLGSPFTALQLLWINLIMDGPPALTLGLEPIRDDLMSRAPTKRDASIVSKGMFSRIAVNGLFIAAVFMLQNGCNILGGTPEQQSSILFSLFVVFQLFNALNSRELSSQSVFKNFFSNKLMLLVFAGTFLLQVVITQFGGFLFGTVALPFIMWVKIFALGFSVVIASELIRLVKRMFSNKKA